MNERIKLLALQAGINCVVPTVGPLEYSDKGEIEHLKKFVELIKQAIYDDVKEELIEDEMINIEPDRLSREYLKGCNGGTVDALAHIKNFGVDCEE